MKRSEFQVSWTKQRGVILRFSSSSYTHTMEGRPGHLSFGPRVDSRGLISNNHDLAANWTPLLYFFKCRQQMERAQKSLGDSLHLSSGNAWRPGHTCRVQSSNFWSCRKPCLRGRSQTILWQELNTPCHGHPDDTFKSWTDMTSTSIQPTNYSSIIPLNMWSIRTWTQLNRPDKKSCKTN